MWTAVVAAFVQKQARVQAVRTVKASASKMVTSM
jgi:hypothetical protein